MLPLAFSGPPLYHILFRVIFYLWLGLEIIASNLNRFRRAPNTLSTSIRDRKDRGSLALIIILWTLAILLDLTLSYHLQSAAIPFHRTALFFTGLGLILFGVAFRWYAILTLGQYFTFDVEVHRDQPIIEAGPYRYIRHPSYTGALISLFGYGLALGNWAGLLVAMACLSIAYAYRIPVEESALTAALGQPYIEYRKRTHRLIPFVL